MDKWIKSDKEYTDIEIVDEIVEEAMDIAVDGLVDGLNDYFSVSNLRSMIDIEFIQNEIFKRLDIDETKMDEKREMEIRSLASVKFRAWIDELMIKIGEMLKEKTGFKL